MRESRLEAADRGKRGDKVANVVEFHDQNAPHLVLVAKWMTRVDLAYRLVVERVVAHIAAESGMVERISLEAEVTPSRNEAGAVVGIFQARSTGELVVRQAHMRGEDHETARLMQPQTEVDVVVDDAMAFVEACRFLEDVATNHHTRSGHGQDVALT